MHPIFQRLRERKLVQWAVAYLAGSWALYQVLEGFGAAWGVSDGLLRAVQLALVVGFFVTLVLAWYHGERGRQQVTGPELLIIAGILGLGGLAIRFLPRGAVPPDSVPAIPVASMPDAASIAVLPFENLSPNPDDAVFTDGFHEDLIAKLMQLRGLRVISRTSVMEYRGGARNLREIAGRLNARNVVEGSVRWAGDNVRITVQLIDATTDEGLWSDQFDEEISLDNLLATQTDVATRIASALHVELTPEESQQLESRPTDDFDAYRLYQLGRSHFNDRTRVGLTRAIEIYQEAVNRDEGYALAHVGLADARSMLAFYGWLPTTDAMERAEAAARTALQLDPESGQARVAFAETVLYGRRDWITADRELRAGRRAAPGYAQGHHWHSYLLAGRGDHEAALEAITQALELDPLSLIVNTWAGVIHRHARRPDDAISQFELTLALDDGFALAHGYLGFTYTTLGRFDEAIAHLERATSIDPEGTRLLGMLGHAYGLADRAGDARSVLDELRSMRAERHVPSYDIGLVHLGMGDLDQAFEAFAVASSERDTMVLFIDQEPAFDGVRTDPRFETLVQEAGLRPAN